MEKGCFRRTRCSAWRRSAMCSVSTAVSRRAMLTVKNQVAPGVWARRSLVILDLSGWLGVMGFAALYPSPATHQLRALPDARPASTAHTNPPPRSGGLVEGMGRKEVGRTVQHRGA